MFQEVLLRKLMENFEQLPQELLKNSDRFCIYEAEHFLQYDLLFIMKTAYMMRLYALFNVHLSNL